MNEQPASIESAPPRMASTGLLPPGSSRQLALLFTDEESRPVVAGLYALEAELRRAVDSRSHEAAHSRLNWWRSELDRLAGGRATHPVAKALLPLRGRGFTEWHLLHELLFAADLDLARRSYRDWTELDDYCHRASGALQTAIAGLLARGRPLSDREHAFARRLGTGLRQAEMLRDLHLDVTRGRIYAPTEALGSAGLDPRSLVHSDGDAATRSFLDAWRDRVRTQLNDLDSLLGSPALRSTQRHGLVLAALSLRQLNRPDTGSRRGSRTIDLEPLARLWTAWRTALRNA